MIEEECDSTSYVKWLNRISIFQVTTFQLICQIVQLSIRKTMMVPVRTLTSGLVVAKKLKQSIAIIKLLKKPGFPDGTLNTNIKFSPNALKTEIAIPWKSDGLKFITFWDKGGNIISSLKIGINGRLSTPILDIFP
jgi:hypothetical protein